MRPLLTAYATALLVSACGGGSSSPPADAPPTSPDAPADPDAPDAPPQGGLATFHDDAAAAICGALFRCCDGGDVEEYFAAYRANERLAAFVDRLPPAVELDEASCREVVAEMIEVTPFGDWVDAAEADRVGFDAGAFDACLAELDGAACGAEVRAALYDGTCLGFAAPTGGAEQRRMFTRTAGVGTACAPLRDGVGAVFYGTCDPTAAFCCYADPANPELGCTFPFDGDGNARAGTCAAIAADGQACSTAPPLQLCATGLSCDDTDRCRLDGTAPLAVGEACVDQAFNVLGECQASYCDLLGTGRCEPLRDDGERCGAAFECASGRCAGTCVTNDVCDGGSPPPPDAGVPDAMVDAMPDAMIDGMPDAPDAGPDAGPGSAESCADAGDLVAASTGTPATGYTYRLDGTFGTVNDTSPASSDAEPPNCSFVYPAPGLDVAYAVTLDPGQRIDLRVTIPDFGAQPAVYVLDGCTPPTIRDGDGSGSCGSNEYGVGFCGPVGCDPASLSFTHPATIGGEPTVARTYWVVIDQGTGTLAAGFELDWRLTP